MMCRFLSALVMPTGDVRWHWNVDSHSVLVRLFGLPDDVDPAVAHRFAKVEYGAYDEGSSWADPDTWSLVLDEDTEPEWWSGVKDRAAKSLRRIAGQIVITDNVEVVADGVYIIAGNGRISEMCGGRVFAMLGSASVKTMLGSASVKTMLGSASVETMLDSASVKTMWGSASVKTMLGSASVKTMRDSASVETMLDSASVKTMWGSASVKTMRGSASVKTMRGSASCPRLPKGEGGDS